MPIQIPPHQTPYVGQEDYVVVNSLPFKYVQGSYVVEEAPRFGEKISTGTLSYQDFNPYESAHSIASHLGGYGLRRYTDLPDPNLPTILDMYDEADGVDCRFGTPFLGPKLTVETIAAPLTANIVWFGEFTISTGGSAGTTRWVAITDSQGVWYRTSATVWTQAITGAALVGTPYGPACGVFGGKLVIGMRGTAVARYTTDLAALNNVTNTAASNLFVWAFTASKAEAYVAGGPVATVGSEDFARIISSVNGGTLYTNPASAVNAGNPNTAVTALSPGGANLLVFVGKTTELGQLDASSAYRNVVPFDSTLATNCAGMRLWLGKGGDEERGASILVFPRDRSLWAYQPSTETAGNAANLSQWAVLGLRPANFKGLPTAIQGTSRWLYYTVQTGSTASRMIARDAQTGVNHSLFTVPNSTTRTGALGVTSLFAGNPLLFVGGISGNFPAYSIILPLDGENPLDDTAYRYTLTGTLTTPAIDLGFPDEQKILFEVHVISSLLSPGSQDIGVAFALDDTTTYTTLGNADGAYSVLQFPTNTSCRRVKLKFTLSTTSETSTPVLLGYSVRMSMNTQLLKVWKMQLLLPSSTNNLGSTDLQEPVTNIDNLWDAREDGFPIPYVDRFGVSWTVRIINMKESEVVREVGQLPQTVIDIALLQRSRGPGNLAYDDALSVYDLISSRYA